MSIGIICEYNPFHNGHLYQINEIKKIYPDSTIICVMSSSFTERGDISILNKWDKTEIALKYGIDLVIELPFVFSSQSADIFAKGATNILNHLKVDKLIFGSETNDIGLLNKLVDIQLNNKNYDKLVKEYLDKGYNYPTAMSKSLYDLSKIKIDQPNDILGISYIKELKKLKSNIEVETIKRTNDYHSTSLNNSIASATSIRLALQNNKNIKKYVPELTYKCLKNIKNFDNNYFSLLKYKILSTQDLTIYQTVDEGIDTRIKKYINECNTLDELINKIKTKRFTYNRIKRMLTHIICSFTKEEANNIEIEYIRILGFNNKGRNYLKNIKKNISIPIITGYKNNNSKILNIEYRVTTIYSCIVNNNELIKKELNKPIY